MWLTNPTLSLLGGGNPPSPKVGLVREGAGLLLGRGPAPHNGLHLGQSLPRPLVQGVRGGAEGAGICALTQAKPILGNATPTADSHRRRELWNPPRLHRKETEALGMGGAAGCQDESLGCFLPPGLTPASYVSCWVTFTKTGLLLPGTLLS